jgi:uncharacterized protein with ParB-like and HNH nuclease domain
MAFQTPLTIAEAVKGIDEKKYLLPSIQREFVWSVEQIAKLFDSLMRDYPIGSFLFWEVEKKESKKFVFYEFMRDYHQMTNRHNEKANLNGSESITAILDGQQRLTSIYIALKGTYAYKLPNKRWDNKSAYPVRKLYLNLLRKAKETEYLYDFDFLTEKEASENDDNHHWFSVGMILDIREQSDVNEYLIEHDLSSNADKKKAKFANRTLFKLYSIIHTNPTISYYQEKSQELDKVLNIFIRVNSGGTPLSYSDLLLSFASAQWDKKDAREEINKEVDEINEIGRGFNINKDFILKASLVLCDFSDISFKVDNFNRSNMMKIQDEWDVITKAIRDAVRLISSFGFCRENITSNNLIIPIAYYLKHIGLPDNFEVSSKTAADRILIKKWFVRALLKRVFSFAPDGVLNPIRNLTKQHGSSGFPFEQIVDRFKRTNRSLLFTEEDISNLLYSKYGHGDTLIIMSILYPWADMRNNFHVDHMYPKSAFTVKRLEKRGIKGDAVQFYMDNYNYLGNLQLLEAIPNIEKSNMDFDKWIEKYIPEEAQADYRGKHLIPISADLSFDSFEDFFEAREELIYNTLLKELL